MQHNLKIILKFLPRIEISAGLLWWGFIHPVLEWRLFGWGEGLVHIIFAVGMIVNRFHGGGKCRKQMLTNTFYQIDCVCQHVQSVVLANTI